MKPALRRLAGEVLARHCADPAALIADLHAAGLDVGKRYGGNGRMREASKAALADPAVRQRMSDARKAAWADPAVRQRMSDARKAALAAKDGLTPEQRAELAWLRRKGFRRAEALRILGLDAAG